MAERIFYFPAFFYLVLFAIVPFGLSIYFSAPSGELSSYVTLFSSSQTLRFLENTFIFSFGSAIFAVVLGTALAIFVDSLVRGRRLFSLLAYLPYTIPFTAAALVWITIYDPINGPADYLLRLLGFHAVDWLGQPSLVIYSVTIVSIWTSIPLAFLVVLAGLSSVPAHLKEAAKVDGVGVSDYYTSIAVPMAKGAILTAFLLTLIIAFGNFDLPYILNEGYSYAVATLPLVVYFQIFYANEVAQGLASGIILTAIVSIFSYLLIRVTLSQGKIGKRGSGATGARLSVPRALKIAFRPLIYVVSALTLLFLLFPVYWMGLIATRPDSLNLYNPPLLWPKAASIITFVATAVQAEPYLITTFVVSLAVMALTLILAAPAAFAVARRRKRWLLFLSIYLFSLPSTTFVFGAYYMIYKVGLLNTWIALILTYPIFTLPFAIWTLSNFYNSLPKTFEEAAHIDGYSPIRAFYRVVMPLARPGLFATALLSFVFSWHLLLFPLVLSETPYQFNFPPTGSFAVTNFAALFDPTSFGSTVGANLWAQVGSAGIIVAVPVIVLALAAQNYLLKGLYSGGTKG